MTAFSWDAAGLAARIAASPLAVVAQSFLTEESNNAEE